MKSAVQILCERVAHQGVVADDVRAVGHDSEPCAICGGPSERGVPIDEFITDSLTDQNTFKSPESRHVCVSCAFVRGRLSQVPGREPKPCDRCSGTGIEPAPSASTKVMKRPKRKPGETCEKCDGSRVKESGGRYANFSHFFDDDRTESASKGEKPKILGWLRGSKRGYWACAIADTGQKHVLPYTPLNPPGARGRIRFEEQEIALPNASGWNIVDDMTAMLTAGATKDEIVLGEYSARAWQLCGEAIRRFEAERGHHRGSAWFDLAIWLSQRDEEQVQARLAAEANAKTNAKPKTKTKVKKETRRGDDERESEREGERGAEGKAADVTGGDAVGVPPGVPTDVASEGARALEDPARQDGDCGAEHEERGRVGDERREVVADPANGQLDLFGVLGAVELGTRKRRVARDAAHRRA